jgi:transcriptional regulator GlxA family with amidase domain
MVRTEHGANVANDLARRLVMPLHRAGGQAQFIANPLPQRGGHRLTELLEWALEHLHEPLPVTDLARQAHMSTRQLSRHFATAVGTTPLQWLVTQRVRRAQELLETTDDSVDQIAKSVGMGTDTTLRRHFNRTIGISPDAYRRAFREDDATRPAR